MQRRRLSRLRRSRVRLSACKSVHIVRFLHTRSRPFTPVPRSPTPSRFVVLSRERRSSFASLDRPRSNCGRGAGTSSADRKDKWPRDELNWCPPLRMQRVRVDRCTCSVNSSNARAAATTVRFAKREGERDQIETDGFRKLQEREGATEERLVLRRSSAGVPEGDYRAVFLSPRRSRARAAQAGSRCREPAEVAASGARRRWYSRTVNRPLATRGSDTSVEAADVQQRILRAMPPSRKVALVEDANRTARMLALAGIKLRFPNASPAEHARMLMDLLQLAAQVYGRADRLPRD